MTETNQDRASAPHLRENKRPWLIPIIIILISTGLAILGSDLALRSFGGKLLYYRPHEMFIERWPRLPLISRYKPDVLYEGEVYGDLAAMVGDVRLRETRQVLFETDAFGFSNSSECRNDDACDVIVLGDSFGVGLGTTQNRTWVAQLRKRYGVRTYNLSIPGSPWQSCVNFAMEAGRLPVHPDSVVLVTLFSGNDLDDDYYNKDMVLSALPWNNVWEATGVRVTSFVKRSPILQLAGRLRHGNCSAAKVLVRELPDDRPMLFYAPYVTSKNRTADMVRDHRNYSSLVGTVRGIKKVAADHGLTVVVALFPSKEEVYEWIIEESQPWDKRETRGGLGVALKTLCEQDKVSFIDLTPSLVAAAERVWKNSGDIIYWHDDTHWNEKGHDIVADIIYEAISAHLSIER